MNRRFSKAQASWSCLVIFALCCNACSYTSLYVPPEDGRARIIWRDDHAAAVLPIAPNSECAAAVHASMGLGPVGETRVYFAPTYVFFALPPVEVPPSPLRRGGGHSASAVGAPRSHDAHVSGPDDGRAWVILAVLATIVLPVVAIGLAVSTPEDTTETARAIAAVNGYQQLQHAPNSPCAPASDMAPAEDLPPTDMLPPPPSDAVPTP